MWYPNITLFLTMKSMVEGTEHRLCNFIDEHCRKVGNDSQVFWLSSPCDFRGLRYVEKKALCQFGQAKPASQALLGAVGKVLSIYRRTGTDKVAALGTLVHPAPSCLLVQSSKYHLRSPNFLF